MKVAEFLLGSIPVLLQFYADLYSKTDFTSTMLELESEYNVPKIKTYDFIIVGGGSAGSILAGRLSEHFDVLLLEAGGTPPPAVAVPYFRGAVGQDPSINYFFKSVPQTNASQCCDGVTYMHTGKMLGGSGSHNDLIHSRGSPRDYDNWATILNDDSFNYANVLKYFKKMETFVGQKFGPEGDEYYGNDGPILVDTVTLPILDLWLNAGRELDYPIGDPNGFQREGFSPMNIAVRKGQRSSSYIEYVKPHEARNTLTVIRYANVSEILVNENKKAYGVTYNRHGFPQIAHAQKEIILSAGAFSSPLLLIKSGIGPESILNAAEIPVKVPLEAVGKNLGDHPCFMMSGFSINDTSLFPRIDPSETEKISEEFHNGEGVLTFVTEGPQCFITSSVAEPGWPDIWIAFDPITNSNGGPPSLQFNNVIGRPQSKGLLSLDAEKYKAGIRDDVQLALVDFKLLTHPDDMEAMLDAIKFVLKIIDTEAFKSIDMSYTAGPDAACGEFTFLTDDYWKCKVQRDTISWIHMVGTCSLGPDTADSTTSVVDTKFRVRGVSNLRVVDASVIPEVTNANLNAPVMMLAEKAAEDIINFYKGLETTNTPTPTTVREETTSNSGTTTDNLLDTTPNGGTGILTEANLVFVVIVVFIYLSRSFL